MRWLSVLSVLLFSWNGLADVIHVPDDYTRIQIAINNAEDGDVILVRPGIYDELIDFSGKAIEIRSLEGPEVTTITARYYDGSVVSIQQGEGPDSILDGFELREGSGNCSIFFCYGGGVFCRESSPTIRNCIIQDNAVDFDGGAIYVYNANPVIEDCLIRNNRANWYNGGGIYVNGESLTIRNCVFEGNNASAVYTENAELVLEGCTFTANISDGRGAAMHCGGQHVTLRNCTFEFNQSDGHGGGLHSSGGGITAEGCAFMFNSGGGHGGAINCDGGGLSLSDCVFTGNTTYGIGPGFKYNGAEPLVMRNCLMENNVTNIADGGAFEVATAPADIRDSVFRHNVAHNGGGGAIRGGAGPTSVVNCVFEANQSTLGMGGGLRIDRNSVDLVNCRFIGNTTVDAGGGLRTDGTDHNIVNCIFASNRAYWRGGAIEMREPGNRIVNCLFSANECHGRGGALNVHESALVANSIFRDDFSANDSTIAPSNENADMYPQRCNIQYWPVGELTVDQVPGYRDGVGSDGIAGTGDEDFRPTSCSAGIDQGDGMLLPADRADIDEDGNTTEPVPLDILGNPRMIEVPSIPNASSEPGFAVDRGPYEFDGGPVACAADVDCNDNGVRDDLDVLECNGEAWCLDCNGNGRPDECDVRYAEPRIDPGVGYWRFDGDTANLGLVGIEGQLVGPAVLGSSVGAAVVPGTGAANTGSLEINESGFVRIRDTEQRYAMAYASYTIEALVRLDQLGGMGSANRRQYLLQRKPGDSAGWKMDYAFLAQGGNLPTVMDRRYGKTSGLSGRELVLQLGGNGSTWCITSFLEIEETGWHYISVAIDSEANIVTFGLNGVFEDVPFEPEARYGYESNLIIGAHQNASGQMNQFLRGAIDELRITRRVLQPDEYLSSWPIGTTADCNDNGVPDGCDIADGLLVDANRDGVPDDCVASGACPGDLNQNGVVDGEDLGLLFASWATDDSAADLSGDGIVNGQDLGLLFVAWGACPDGACGAGACDDEDECTTNACNPVTGACQFRRYAGCVTDPCFDVVCDDGDACTDDSCDPLTGECVFTLIEDCQPDPCKDIICDDGNPCTEDSCISATGQCQYVQIPGCEPPGCGDELAGSCYRPNSTPNCSDAACCESVCAADDYCCTIIWDAACVDLAKSICP